MKMKMKMKMKSGKWCIKSCRAPSLVACENLDIFFPNRLDVTSLLKEVANEVIETFALNV